MKVLILGIGLTVTVLWTYHEARVKTAKFLRFTADFLSPIHRPIEQRNRKRERKKKLSKIKKWEIRRHAYGQLILQIRKKRHHKKLKRIYTEKMVIPTQ